MECKKELVWMYLLIIISFVTSVFPAWVGFSPQCLKIEMKGNLNLTVFVQTKKTNHISKKKKNNPASFVCFKLAIIFAKSHCLPLKLLPN